MAEDRAAPYLLRLAAVEERLATLAASPHGGLSDAEPRTGERWDQGQIWAHCAEFVPYWMGQLDLLGGRGEPPIPFGRTAADPGRIASIERGRGLDTAAQHARVVAGVAALRGRLAGMPAARWEAHGVHPTLGVVGVERILEEFLVGHLEQHAQQLGRLHR